ncbi:hypothetical protein [Embleya sp. NPDC001921]
MFDDLSPVVGGSPAALAVVGAARRLLADHAVEDCVLGSIGGTGVYFGRFLRPAKPVPPPVEIPQWCGNCDDDKVPGHFGVRWRIDNDGRAYKCPDCHPYAHPWRGKTDEHATRMPDRDVCEGLIDEA